MRKNIIIKRVVSFLRISFITIIVIVIVVAIFDFALYKLDILGTRGWLGNSLVGFGARKTEHILRKVDVSEKPGHFRIVTVGDSHTELSTEFVPRELQHPYVLERVIREKGIDADVF